MATLTVPNQHVAKFRTALRSTLSADGETLGRCFAGENGEYWRGIIAKLNALAGALDALGWDEGENGEGDATLECESSMLAYMVDEVIDITDPAPVGDRLAQSWVGFLSDAQDRFAAVG